MEKDLRTWRPPETKLDTRTLVFDRERQQQVMWIEGVVALPVGADIELLNPNVNARVLGVRLLAGDSKFPVMVCLDVHVPAEYWGWDTVAAGPTTPSNVISLFDRPERKGSPKPE